MLQLHCAPPRHQQPPFAELDSILATPCAPHKSPTKSIEFMWRLFNSFPKRYPRLIQAQEAANRMTARRRTSILPTRDKYCTTVDYFEAAEPLLVAKISFAHYFTIPVHLRSIRRACTSIIPRRLF